MFATGSVRNGVRWFALASLAASLGTVSLRAQVTEKAAPSRGEEMRAALLTDLENLRGKFVGLAEAFPADKYTWRPMDGVRSVSEGLMHAAFEAYSFIPGSFGGQRADLGPNAAGLRTLSDKAQVLDHLNKAFAHCKTQLETVDAATLVASRSVLQKMRGPTEITLLTFGDQHEHLGQLIAYARMNKLVPPWSK